jgi:hypothetical protein
MKREPHAECSLAVNYLFLTNNGLEEHPELTIEPFNANSEQNDYEVRLWCAFVRICGALWYHGYPHALLSDRYPGHSVI